VNHASYDDIAEWYDSYLRENPIYHEIVLPCVGYLARPFSKSNERAPL
jgi:hypothetical protein